MNWEDRIVCDPAILLGKPTIKGTRLSVAFILDRLADGWTEKMLYENYPRLKPADLQAIFAYAADCLKEDFAFSRYKRN